jgi:hypothetical protein
VALLYLTAFHVESRLWVFLVGALFVIVTMIERLAAGYRVLGYKQLVRKLRVFMDREEESTPVESGADAGRETQ